MEHGGNLDRIEREYGIAKKRITDFSANINPFIKQRLLYKAARAGMRYIRHYPDPGYTTLKAALACYAGARAREIVPGNGAAELIFRFVQAVKPAHALVVTPAFSGYEQALAAAGAAVSRFKLEADNGFALDAEKLAAQLTPGYDLLVLGNPGNPAGTFADRHAVEGIVRRAAGLGIKVLLDEAFIEFAGLPAEVSAVPLTARYRNLVIARSLTKCFAIPGLRLGYTVCSDEAVNGLLVRNLSSWNINCIALQAALFLLKQPGLPGETLKKNSRERDYLYGRLCAIPWLQPFRTQANFILVKILNNIAAGRLQELLLKQAILVRDASNFTHLDHSFIRVAVKERKANNKLISALERVTGNRAAEYRNNEKEIKK